MLLLVRTFLWVSSLLVVGRLTLAAALLSGSGKLVRMTLKKRVGCSLAYLVVVVVHDAVADIALFFML